MIKRYDLAASASGGYSLQESEYGNWVTWGEHYKLEQQLAELREIIRDRNYQITCRDAELAELRELSHSLELELYKVKGMLTEKQYAALLQEPKP